jgi:hypothetical protein
MARLHLESAGPALALVHINLPADDGFVVAAGWRHSTSLRPSC